MIAKQDRLRILGAIAEVIEECKEDAKEMRENNNALNDQGILSLIQTKISKKLAIVLQDQS